MKTLLDDETLVQTPLFRGEPAGPPFADDDIEFENDEPGIPAPPDEESAWEIDTGAGEAALPAKSDRSPA